MRRALQEQREPTRPDDADLFFMDVGLRPGARPGSSCRPRRVFAPHRSAVDLTHARPVGRSLSTFPGKWPASREFAARSHEKFLHFRRRRREHGLAVLQNGDVAADDRIHQLDDPDVHIGRELAGVFRKDRYTQAFRHMLIAVVENRTSYLVLTSTPEAISARSTSPRRGCPLPVRSGLRLRGLPAHLPRLREPVVGAADQGELVTHQQLA